MTHKTINIPFPIDLYNLVKRASSKDSRSLAGWIKVTLERAANKELNK